jgi:hypothetical protein
MGISLRSLGNEDHWFEVNFWNWRPIVELIRSLAVIPDERVNELHQPFCNFGLSEAEAIAVAAALEAKVLPGLSGQERVLLDTSTTREPDDYVLHKEEPARNYSTTKLVLVEFIQFCRTCKGFVVL